MITPQRIFTVRVHDRLKDDQWYKQFKIDECVFSTFVADKVADGFRIEVDEVKDITEE